MKIKLIRKRCAVLLSVLLCSGMITGCSGNSDSSSADSSGFHNSSNVSGITESRSIEDGTQTQDSNRTEESSNEEPEDPGYTLGTIVESGECGPDVTFELDESGLLVISGSGDMDIEDYNDCPWKVQRENIKTVIIKNGVTSIGKKAFKDCTSLTAVTIPDSVTSIGEEAFYYTKWWDSQPDGLVYAGKVVLGYKGNTPGKIVLKDGTKGIADGAFSNCTVLTDVTIPDSVTSIGGGAFEYCTSLTAISGKSGSYAGTYAKEHGIKFIISN